jgi:serine protease AprX
MKKIFVLFLISISSLVFSQTKYLIYFKDKDVQPDHKLLKTEAAYREALNLLSNRAIERRDKNMGDNIITYEDIPIKADYIREIENEGIKIENKLRWFNAVSAYLNDQQYNYVLSLSFVKKILKVKILKFKDSDLSTNSTFKTNTFVQNDYGPSFNQYQLSDIPLVHSKGINGDSIIIGILDTGFRWKQEESLVDKKVIGEYDFVFHDSVTANQPGDAPGQDFHGTLIFSVIGGFKEGQIIAPDYNSSFILAKTEDTRSESHIEEDNYAAALQWMESMGVDITTSSLGYNIFDDTTYSYTYADMNGRTTIITKAAELAFARGVVTITAAGNEGSTSWYYIVAPADGFNTIAVGAVDTNKILAGFSSHGPSADGRIKPDIVADGVSVYGASVSGFNSYTRASGTSLSTPIAAGVAGLLLSARPYLINTQVRSILLESSDNADSVNNDIGYGLVSAADAISFPCLEALNANKFVLHKAFLKYATIDPSSVNVFYSTDDINFTQAGMNYDGNWDFTYELPTFAGNQMLSFYFTYTDSSGSTYRDPVENFYKINYGNLEVSFHLPLPVQLTNNLVSDLYPNPFLPFVNENVKFIYKSTGSEKLSWIIIDAAGRKVREMNRITSPGQHPLVCWDGRDGRGNIAASGVYYFLIDIGGKKYGKKLILLK